MITCKSKWRTIFRFQTTKEELVEHTVFQYFFITFITLVLSVWLSAIAYLLLQICSPETQKIQTLLFLLKQAVNKKASHAQIGQADTHTIFIMKSN